MILIVMKVLSLKREAADVPVRSQGSGVEDNQHVEVRFPPEF